MNKKIFLLFCILCILLSLGNLHAQNLKEIRGTIKDKSGTLQGVSVMSKEDTTNGVITDANGRYVIKVPENTVLVFKSIGYKPVEIPVTGKTTIDATLENDAVSLDNLVVVGYGKQKKSSLTSAVSDLRGEDLNKRPVANASQALQGLAPGVTVIDGGGGPGQSNATIRVRGITTLSGNDPLIIIDGIEQSLQDVNPNDIESITVLKDAASTSIYGSRAANGVVLVTTKRARAGEVKVNLNSYYAIQKAIYHPKQMGMEDYMRMQNVAFENAGAAAPFSEEDIHNWINSTDRIKYPLVNDWINVLFKPAPQQSHTLSIGGGTEKMRTLLSLNYFDQAGIIPNSHSQQENVRINTDYKLNKRITISGDFNYRTKTYKAPADESNVFKRMWASSNFAVPRYPDGTYGLSPDGISPLVDAELGGISNFTVNNGLVNLKAEVELLKGLKFQTQYGRSISDFRQKTFRNAYEIRDYYNKDRVLLNVSTNSLLQARNSTNQSTLNNLLTYDVAFNKHSLNALLGYSQISFTADTLSASRNNFYNNNVQALSQGSVDSRNNSGYEASWGLRSYFGRLSYNYAEKYFLEMNARYDGSSRFSASNRYGFFPSFSGAWRLSKEAFWDDFLNVADEFKVRASWGKTANQNVGLYSYLETLEARNYTFAGNPVQGLYQSILANNNLTWETTTQSNVGMDASFWRGKLGVTFDYYNKITDGILLYLPIPLTVGLNAPPQNAGSVQNKGWELALSHRGRISNFKYNLAFNISDVKNNITNLAGTGPYITEQYYTTTIRKEGLPIDAFIGYKSDGFFKSDDEAKNYPTLFPNTRAGDLKYIDVNKDGVVNPDDMVYIGSDIPHYTFGLNANVEYKNFDLNLFLQGVGKANGIISEFAGNVEWQSFVLDVQKDYWTPQHTNAKFPRPEAFADKNWVASDFWVVNTAYLKLKNLQIGYTLPSNLINRLKVQRLRIYLSGSNLFTISKANEWGFDPEFNSSLRYYPQLSLYTLGINLTF